MSIGDRLKEIRGEENQTSFGSKFGKSRNTILRYESEQNPLDTDFVSMVCKDRNISPSWLLLGEGPKELRLHEVDAHVDAYKAIMGDPDAARRRQDKIKKVGPVLQAARETADQAWQEIGGDTLPEPQTELEKRQAQALIGLKERYKAAEFGRLAAEEQANELAAATKPLADDFHLSMGDSMELLVNIHKSGNNILIRAINANLMAFNEAIENRERSETTINAIREMREQMLVMKGDLSELRQENQELQRKLLSREDREQKESAG